MYGYLWIQLHQVAFKSRPSSDINRLIPLENSPFQQVISPKLLWFVLAAAVKLSSHNLTTREYYLLWFFHHFRQTAEVWSERRHSLLKLCYLTSFYQILAAGEGSHQPSQRIILSRFYCLCPHHHANKDSTTTIATTTNCHWRGSSCCRATREQQP